MIVDAGKFRIFRAGQQAAWGPREELLLQFESEDTLEQNFLSLEESQPFCHKAVN